MHVHHEVLQPVELVLGVVVVAEQLPDLGTLGLLQRDVVRVSAEDILELALQLVDIVVMLACEFEFNLFILGLGSLLFLGSLVEVLPQVLDDTVVMMTVLLPELAELFGGGLVDLEHGVSNFESLFDQNLKAFLLEGLFIDCEVSFGLVESNIR